MIKIQSALQHEQAFMRNMAAGFGSYMPMKMALERNLISGGDRNPSIGLK